MPGRSSGDGGREAAGAGGHGALEPRTTAGGRRVHVDVATGTRGSLGAFHPTYLDTDRRERYGWCCSRCGSTGPAMDPMGRIACDRCENRRRPTRWDAAYL